MRVGVVGDIHAHHKGMVEMIATLEEHGVDRIVLLGDLVDRGPDPFDCLETGRTWDFANREGELIPYDVIRGNHEDAYVRIRDKQPKPGRTRVEGPESRRLYERLTKEELDWMAALPVYLEFPQLDLVCLHGGVTPHMKSLDDGGEFILRCRYLDKNLKMGRSLSGQTFWAKIYDGRFGTIVFGHESHAKVTMYPHAIAIDGEGYRRVHGIVVSDEEGDERITAYSVDYLGRHVGQDLSYDPDRIHDWTPEPEPVGQRRVFEDGQMFMW